MKKKNATDLDTTWVIHNHLKGSHLTSASFKSVNTELKRINQIFGISAFNAAILCSIIQESLLEGEVAIKTLVDHYKMDNRQLVAVTEAIEELCERDLVEKCERSYQRNSRRIAPMPVVLDAIIKGDGKLKPQQLDDLSSFFYEFSGIQNLRQKGTIESEKYISQVHRLCLRSKHLPGISYFLSFELPLTELTMLISISQVVFQGAEMAEVSPTVKEVTDMHSDYYSLCSLYRTKELALFKEDLIEYSLMELGIDTDVSLTQLAREQLFTKKSKPLKQAFKPTLTHYLSPNSIKPVDLIFDEEFMNKMESIRNAMKPDNYSRLQCKMKENNFRGGFTMLFHGAPGTGKTESVYQLARETNRVVLRLEISSIKAMWVGESEKNLKKVFTEYKRTRKTHEHDPILLFNEADAIFSDRREVNTSVDQMENSLQNILLQELEEFEGILIATTNLIENLDAAFERRFLFKMKFVTPSPDTRFKLLSKSFSKIEEEKLKLLAHDYAFTGSTIENIKRKIFIEELLGAESKIDSTKLSELLITESYSFSNTKSIGFKRQ